jgi:copper transport protein
VSGAVPGADENGPGTAALLALTRGLGYVGLVLGPGVLLVALTLWPAGLQDRRVRRVLAVGAGVLAVTTVGGGLLQGVWGSGLPLRALWVTPAELDTHSRRFDTVFALRSYLVVGFGVALAAVLPAVPAPAEPAPRRSRRRPPVPARPGRGRVGGVVALSVALLGTWSAAGHAAVGPDSPLAVVSDVVHLAAMTVWLGGLVLLAVGLTSSGRAAELAVVVPRFSRLAQVAVTLLVATGVFQVWREVGSVAALTGTSFGRLLLVKLAGVGVLLLLGDVSRRWVLRHTAPARGLLAPRLLAHASGPGLAEREAPADPVPDAPAVRLLRRGLLGELAVAACVLGLTAVLVATVPARQAYVAPVEQTVEAAGLTVDVRVDAPRVGDTVVHLDVHRPDGTPVAVQQLTGAVSPPEPGAAPLPVRPLPPGPDAARPEAGLSFTGAGDWTLQLTVQTSALDATSLTVTVPVT